jgi:acyl-CoA thioesterase-1
MESKGIAINDLYAYAMPRLGEIQKPANVHFTNEGSIALAEQVAQAIQAARKP